MALNYDFDMFAAGPAEIGDADNLDAGTDPAQNGNPVALFRDPATVAALGRAGQVVQDYLRASGFGMNAYHSGAPDGRYPAADENARILVIQTLTENLGRFELPATVDGPPPEDDFDLPLFFASVVAAEPLPREAVLRATPDQHDASATVKSGGVKLRVPALARWLSAVGRLRLPMAMARR